jgi:hypothetical protein
MQRAKTTFPVLALLLLIGAACVTVPQAAAAAIHESHRAVIARPQRAAAEVMRVHVRSSGIYEVRLAVGSKTPSGRLKAIVAGHRTVFARSAHGAFAYAKLVFKLVHRSFAITVSGGAARTGPAIHVHVRRLGGLRTPTSRAVVTQHSGGGISGDVPSASLPSADVPAADEVVVGGHAGGGQSIGVAPPLDASTQPKQSLGSDTPVPVARPTPSSSVPVVSSTDSSVGSAASKPLGVAGSWKLAFDDEFSGSSLDSTKWSTGWFGSGITGPVNSSELECYDPSQVVQSNGELDLNLIKKSETCGGTSRPYTSGIVTTNGKFSFTYGYVEVRSWLPADSSGAIADWPGIWANGQSWPTDGELDILEGLSGSACWHFHSPSGGPGGCANGTWTGGWHTFGADWQPGSVTYYYDGIKVGAITTGITGAPLYIILGLGSDPNSTVTAPATQRTDYVRVWQH